MNSLRCLSLLFRRGGNELVIGFPKQLSKPSELRLRGQQQLSEPSEFRLRGQVRILTC